MATETPTKYYVNKISPGLSKVNDTTQHKSHLVKLFQKSYDFQKKKSAGQNMFKFSTTFVWKNAMSDQYVVIHA